MNKATKPVSARMLMTAITRFARAVANLETFGGAGHKHEWKSAGDSIEVLLQRLAEERAELVAGLEASLVLAMGGGGPKRSDLEPLLALAAKYKAGGKA